MAAKYHKLSEAERVKLVEMKNSLEQSRERFVDLYDFAPIAYITLDINGIVQEINLTEVRDRQGNLPLLRIRPYKNLENRIEGVLALFDPEPARRNLLDARQALVDVQEMLDLVDQPAVVLGEDYRILHHNPVFAQQFMHDGMGESIYRVMDGHIDVGRLRIMLQEMLPREGRVDRFDLGKTDGRSAMHASEGRLGSDGTETASLVVTFSK